MFVLRSGVLVPGGFGSRGSEGKVQAARWARLNNVPYLGELYDIIRLCIQCSPKHKMD